jgi:hypothetical protein
MASETKARKAIRRCIERRGGEVVEMTWYPIGQMVEMSGREGGWTVIARMPRRTNPDETFEDNFLGYSWLDVIVGIELNYPPPENPDE